MSLDNVSLSDINFDNTEISSDEENVFQQDVLMLGSKGNEESSSDLNSLKIDDLNIQIKKDNNNLNLDENFYDLNRISSINNLYEIFSSCDMLIFVDNYKLNVRASCFSRCKVLKDSKFRVVLFYHLNM